jgi:hypothetical protein
MKKYPIGTVFIRQSVHEDGAWYTYDAPGVGTGMVYFADKVHHVITEEEQLLIARRAKDRRNHLIAAIAAGHIFLPDED